MLSKETIEKIKSLAEEVSAREGCRLYDVELVGGSSLKTLRIFIDDPKASVSVEQCANVSRGLSLLLDVEDLVAGGSYDLEVSSPGLERPLRQMWHYEGAIGKSIAVTTRDLLAPINGALGAAKSIKGELVEVTPEHILLKNKEKSKEVEWKVPFEQIHKAKVLFKMQEIKKEKKR